MHKKLRLQPKAQDGGGEKVIATGNKSEFGQPLFKCEECKNEFTVTYTLLGSELCWSCYQDFKA